MSPKMQLPRSSNLVGDPRSTEELIQAALRGDLEDEPAWEAVRALQGRPTLEVLDAARRLCLSSEPRERSRGADILAQLGAAQHLFVEERLTSLLELLATEQVPSVLHSATVALGHVGDVRAVPALVRHKAHSDAGVRYGVAFGLLGLKHPDALSALIELSADEDEEVRDWAAFGLGSQTDTDTPELREALFRRTEDPHDDTRGEAILGLALRHDPRAVELVARELLRGYAGPLYLEAAAELADPSLVPMLRALRDHWGKRDWLRDEVDRALARCEGKNAQE
ncbi:HEAT repeat domain-containing protein [Hyalangium sp.]|uniref:HEAT repeat domain-containing protein n=1 Tax=Hyalangium sp. TaxID=2028555 RepID=UPI002D717D1A|nr:HEAT repeat domain-containing protein [Hyalangium sp.]HYI01789.1 HEAT repeat domain-containing protein [Hyalangium sp.]